VNCQNLQLNRLKKLRSKFCPWNWEGFKNCCPYNENYNNCILTKQLVHVHEDSDAHAGHGLEVEALEALAHDVGEQRVAGDLPLEDFVGGDLLGHLGLQPEGAGRQQREEHNSCHGRHGAMRATNRCCMCHISLLYPAPLAKNERAPPPWPHGLLSERALECACPPRRVYFRAAYSARAG
jgi:hypothetical protein